MKWTRMEDLSAGSQFDSDLQITYRYASETWLLNSKGERIGSVERWSTSGGGHCKSHSRYEAWVFPSNGEPTHLGVFCENTLKECKGFVLNALGILPA